MVGRHGPLDDEPVGERGDVGDLAEQEAHREVEEERVLPQQVHRPQRVDPATPGQSERIENLLSSVQRFLFYFYLFSRQRSASAL